MAEQSLDHTRQVQLLFDAKAGSWAAKYAPDGRLAGRLTQLADAIGYHVPTGGRVLDLGCGTGELARHLAGTGLRVTVDILQKSVRDGSEVCGGIQGGHEDRVRRDPPEVELQGGPGPVMTPGSY